MARNPSTRWYSALAVLIIFVLLAWLLGAVLTLSDGERVALRVGLVALGLIGACALLWYLRPQEESVVAPTDTKGDDVVATVAAARARLPRGVFDSKALVLVVGTEGSCKTTLVARSGTDPELLAGDATAGSDISAKTALANLWLVKDAVIAEAGGPVFADAAGWRRLVRALRAPRMAAAFGRGVAAPRAAVVCVSCDLFRAANAHAQLEGLAKLTRERLTEAAREWGVAIPVYVLFTKADRIPHFETWVAPLTRDEVRAPVGAALPFDAAAASNGAARARAVGTYAERIVPRIDSAFASIVSALAGHRLDLLGRESQPERRLEAYELPRELGKLAPEASKFLVEICRPVHLGVSPQLRGFYFVGARPVVVTDAAPSQVVTPRVAAPPQGAASSATNVFVSMPAPGSVPSVAATPARSTTRRVPQWVFLERLFPDVILADGGAAAMARGGVRVARVRRALLGVGIAAALVVSFGVLRSWLGNRALAVRTSSAARDVTALPVVSAPTGTIAFPSADALRRLDALRGVLDTLQGFTRAGVPQRLTWGLWRGDTLLAAGRQVWLAAYQRQLHGTAFGVLVDSLRALPDAPRPTDEYGHDYAMLKAYLIMTGESPRSTPDFLAPVLLTSWTRGQPIDVDVMALARRQFEFYASLLAQENPWPQSADARVVNRTRAFLNRFSGGEQIYQYMIAQADKGTPPARLAEAAALAPGVIFAPAEVSGAFTAAGWEFMQNAFRNSDRYFEGEGWVVGDATATQTQDRDRILAELRARYQSDYVQKWRTFVKATSVVRPIGARDAAVKDAAKKIGILGGAQSPLLAALAMVARNTDVDSIVAAAFQPVHTVIPPNSKGNVHENNKSYVDALMALWGALEQVGFMQPNVDTASAAALSQKGQEALGQVTQAKIAARQLAQKFAVDTAALKIGPAVAALLEAPINGAEALLRGIASTRPPAQRPVVVAPAPAPAAAAPPPAPSGGGGGGADKAKALELATELNGRGRAICEKMTPMLAKFPFDPAATAEATVAEVTGLLAPAAGELAAFQEERLGDLLAKQGGQWVAKGGAPVTLSAPFVTFFNRAARVSAALFGVGSSPQIVFFAKGVTSSQTPLVTLVHGSEVARFNQNTPTNRFVWPAPSGREAQLKAQFGKNKEQVIKKATGEWAMFRLVAQSDKVDEAGGSLRAEWNATGKDASPVSVVFSFESGAPIFQRGWLGGMSCVSQVTR